MGRVMIIHAPLLLNRTVYCVSITIITYIGNQISKRFKSLQKSFVKFYFYI